jgi:hypothetical protein
MLNFTSCCRRPGDRQSAGNPHSGTGVTALTNSSGQVVAYLANDPTARILPPVSARSAVPAETRSCINPINDFDMALVKKFSIRESVNLQFGIQAFSVFNHPQFVPGQLNIST